MDLSCNMWPNNFSLSTIASKNALTGNDWCDKAGCPLFETVKRSKLPLNHHSRIPTGCYDSLPNIVSFQKKSEKLVQNKQLIAVTRLASPCVRKERKRCYDRNILGCHSHRNSTCAPSHPFRAPPGFILTSRMTTLIVCVKSSGGEQKTPRRSLMEVKVHLRGSRLKTARLQTANQVSGKEPLRTWKVWEAAARPWYITTDVIVPTLYRHQ